ncbi:MAG: sigma-70 family RNA polymerase sigma factor [Bacteroidota bacterium]
MQNSLAKSAIIEHLRGHDERMVDRAFESLYREHAAAVRSFVMQKGGNAEDAADVFQDALIVFYKKIRSNGFELHCSIGTYLFAVSKNLWLNKVRKHKKEIIGVDGWPQDELGETDVPLMEENPNSLAAAKALKKMGGDCEQLLVDFFFNGLETTEITQRMGYANEQVTRNKKSRCLKKLRILFRQLKSQMSI